MHVVEARCFGSIKNIMKHAMQINAQGLPPSEPIFGQHRGKTVWLVFLRKRRNKMKVKELIERVEQIQNKEMEVFVLNQFDGFSDIYEVEQFTNCVAISGDIKSEY